MAPRVGFAYALGDKSATVIRGSFGLFYIQEDLLDVSQAFASNGVTRPFLVVVGPAFGNTNPLLTYPSALSSFPTGAGGNPSIVVFSPTFRSPYVEQANFALEHQFGAHTALSVGYVYSHGLRLLGNSNGVTRQANGNFGFDLNLVPPSQQLAFGGNFNTASVTLPNGKTYNNRDRLLCAVWWAPECLPAAWVQHARTEQPSHRAPAKYARPQRSPQEAVGHISWENCGVA